MHGDGWDSMHVDEHKGEGLGAYRILLRSSQSLTAGAGVGRWALWLARYTLPPHSAFTKMTPYAHLRYFYILCIVHFLRNLKPYESRVSPEVLAAMFSLSSAEPLPDLQATLKLIESGGKAAAGAFPVTYCLHVADGRRLAQGQTLWRGVAPACAVPTGEPHSAGNMEGGAAHEQRQ